MMTTSLIATLILYVLIGIIGIVFTATVRWLGFALVVASLGCLVWTLSSQMTIWIPDRTRREKSLLAIIMIAVALALLAASIIWATGIVLKVLIIVSAIIVALFTIRLVSVLTGRAINWMLVVAIMLVLLVMPLLFKGTANKPVVNTPVGDVTTDITTDTTAPDTTVEPDDTTDVSQYCPKAEHEWDEGTKKNNITVFVCENCGEVKVVEDVTTDAPVTDAPTTQNPSGSKPSGQTPSTQAPHTHSYVSSITVAATCKNTGVKTYSCSCGSSYTETITMTNHNYSESIVKAATEYAEGEKRLTCTACGNTKTEKVERLKHYTHKYELDKVLVAATCEDAGVAQYKCPCGATETRAIEANGNHQWDDGVVAIAPTTTRTGMRKDTCELCGATNLVVIPKLEDDDDYPDYGDDDCSHSYKKSTVEEPTAYEGGKVKYTCRKCGDSYTETTDPVALKLRASDDEMEYGDEIIITTSGYAFNLTLVNDSIAELVKIDEHTVKLVLIKENAGGSLVVYDSIVPTTQVEVIIKPNLD